MDQERVKLSVAAKILDVTPLTLRRGIYAGRVPFIKTCTNRLYIPMTWIREQTGDSVSTTNFALNDIHSIITNHCVKRYGQEKGIQQAQRAIKHLDI